MDNVVLMQISNLTTHFHTDEGTVFAVNGISYDIKVGETLGIVGESGCGKSVHALSIMRLIPTPPGDIVAGSVMYHGQDLLTLPKEEMQYIRGGDIAMIFQDPMTSLNPVFTVGFQIAEALQIHEKMNKRQAYDRAAELLDMVGIPDSRQRLNSYPHEFSGGMRQRAMIAMGLSCNPHLRIADEPTTALDVTIQAQIIDLVKKLREQLGMSIIWITHDLGVVAGLVDRVQVMYTGYIVERAPVKELYANPRHPYTLGLLKSLPRIDKGRIAENRLTPIGGRPPDQLDLPEGCPFMPRCAFAESKCKYLNPPLRQVSAGHEIACWIDIQHSDHYEVPAPTIRL